MPSANKTPNIGLNNWEGNEYVKRQDFIDDNLKIDEKFGEVDEHLGDIATKCLYVGITSGTSTAYTSTTDKLNTYNDGDTVTIVPHVDSGTNPTLNINNLGALPLLDSDGDPVSLKADKPYTFVRVGNNFFLRGGISLNVPRYIVNYSKGTNRLLPLPSLIHLRNFMPTFSFAKNNVVYTLANAYDGSQRMKAFLESIDLETLDTKLITLEDLIGGVMSDPVVAGDAFYLLGGDSTWQSQPAISKYNLLTKTFEHKFMVQGMNRRVSTVAIDNLIYCFGGYGGGSYASSIVGVLDVNSKTYTAKQNMITGRSDSITALKDNVVYVVGGVSGSNLTGSDTGGQKNEAYDIQANTWTTKTPPPFRSGRGGSITLENDTIVFITDNGYRYIYDTLLDTWSAEDIIYSVEQTPLFTICKCNNVIRYDDKSAVLTLQNGSCLYKY
jgi:hypothetical protein